MAWWIDDINNDTHFHERQFILIHELLGEVNPLLASWVISFENNSFRNYVNFLYNHFNDLDNRKSAFRALDSQSRNHLVRWLIENSPIIETGFFHFESIDPEFAEQISIAQGIMEREV